MERSINIVGCRGIPAAHGGFETFAEKLALHLAGRGWKVTVYCQVDGKGSVTNSFWRGVRLVHVPVNRKGPVGTIIFDWISVAHSVRENGINLVLGYNTAVFSLRYRLAGRRSIMNMDGIEWKRSKWSQSVRVWFWLNESFGCRVSDHLIADNPHIAEHLMSKVGKGSRISMIPYGSDVVNGVSAEPLREMGVEPKRYATLIARPEPENSVLEVVRAFSRVKSDVQLVVLGDYSRSRPYQSEVLAAAGDNVKFVGSIYERSVLAALRYHSLFYVHGHQVGGTNPSLVEALGAGNAVLAFDSPFNRWVAGKGALYFKDEEECSRCAERLIGEGKLRQDLSRANRSRHAEVFTWKAVLGEYESLLESNLCVE